jgi:valyl-tRNA synthetase
MHIKDIEGSVSDVWAGPLSATGPGPRASRPFVMALAIPNVTGGLHLGHALNLLIQDVIVRDRARRGFDVYCPPGTDHAGLLGQHVAERHLSLRGVARGALEADAFLQELHGFRRQMEARVFDDMRRMGITTNWDASVHTLDETRRHRLVSAFADLYEKDVLYRTRGLVNWCPNCETCLSNSEISPHECEETLHRLTLRTSEGRRVELVTLHLELLLGCTALGMTRAHPDFDSLLGCYVELPVVGRQLRIVERPPRRGRPAAGLPAEHQRVLREHDALFDSTLTLVVPAYNADDYELATREGLECVDVYGPDGKISGEHRQFAGQVPEECQHEIARLFVAHGVSIHRESYLQGRAHHKLCGAHVRPRVCDAWYLRVEALRAIARDLLEHSETQFNHPHWRDQYLDFQRRLLESSDAESKTWWEGACLAVVKGFTASGDWIISRQNRWGLPLPAFHCTQCRRATIAAEAPSECPHCGSHLLEPDSDVLDVMFGCSLWAFTLTPWSNRPYDADCAVLGVDILDFWIGTADLMTRLLGRSQISVKHAVVHGMVCDEHGRKMSKSLGNAIPLEQVIAEHGAESLRSGVFSAFARSAGCERVPLQARDFELATARLSAWARWLLEAVPTHTADAGHVSRVLEKIDEHLAAFDVGSAYAHLSELFDELADQKAKLDAGSFLRLVDRLGSFHPFLTAYLRKTVLRTREQSLRVASPGA